ncbi:uncharacterized protein LOC127283984 [Leptopilina boulardi]|uniref:uncharacterized protein LOC127283984 n=1 Tax=Leptopilina boulardi TaxID=63433 RepID=UPI0021F5D09A|nr:uncharacterized protein LOC127283984 [Leptopilina boulardi]
MGYKGARDQEKAKYSKGSVRGRFRERVASGSNKNDGLSFNFSFMSAFSVGALRRFVRMKAQIAKPTICYGHGLEHMPDMTISAPCGEISQFSLDNDNDRSMKQLKKGRPLAMIHVVRVEEFRVNGISEAIKAISVIRQTGLTYTWFSYLQSFTIDYYFQEEKVWLYRVVSLYGNLMKNNVSTLSNEFQNLYEEIPKSDGIKRHLMISAFRVIIDSLNSQAEYLCFPLSEYGYKLQVKGISLVFDNSFTENYCDGKVIILEIMALDRIIFDEESEIRMDIEQLIIVAPIWEITSNININLQGYDGRNLEITENLRFLLDIIANGSSTKYIDGLPGAPGGAGGSFFGMVDTILGGEKLFIICNGGNGGDGNHGIDGIVYLSDEYPPGKGGKKGLGGPPGMGMIFNFNYSTVSNIEIIAEKGDDGIDGPNGSYKDSPEIKEEIEERKHFTDSLLSYYLNNVKKDNDLKIMNPLYKINSTLSGIEDFFITLKDYRKYVVTKAIETGSISWAHLYEKLNNNPNVVKNIDTFNFVNEILDFEGNYSINLNKVFFHKLYKGWHKGVQLKGIHLFTNELHHADKIIEYNEVFTNLYNMIERKIEKISDNPYYSSIHVIDDYLTQSIQDGEELRRYQVLNKLQEFSNNFRRKLDIQIEEAVKLIDVNLTVFLDQKIEDVNKELTELIKEIDEMISTKKVAIKTMEEKKSVLNRKLALKILFSILKFTFIGVAFVMGPAGAIVAAMLNTGIFILEDIAFNTDTNTGFKDIKMPEGVNSLLKSSLERYNNNRKKEEEDIKKQLDLIEQKRKDLILEGEDVQPINDFNKKIHENCILKGKEISSQRKCMIEELEIEKNKWTMKSENAKTKSGKAAKYLSSMVIVTDVLNTGIERYNKITVEIAAKNQNQQQINKEENDINKLEAFKNMVKADFGQQIDQIRMNIQNKSKEFTISSSALLEYQKFHMDDYLTNISSQLEKWTMNLKISDEVSESMTKLKKAMKAIINMHALIKDYNFKIENAQYLKDIASTQFQITNIKDSKLLKVLTKVEQLYYSNDVLDDYNKLVISMKCYTYPFIKEYSFFISIPKMYFDSNLIKASIALEKMKNLQSKLIKKKGQDTLFYHILQTNFINGGDFPPFYTWHNSTHSLAIKDLLEGKEVKLFANISHEDNYNALKFRNISISFFSEDPQINEQLKKDLKKFAKQKAEKKMDQEDAQEVQVTSVNRNIANKASGEPFSNITSTKEIKEDEINNKNKLAKYLNSESHATTVEDDPPQWLIDEALKNDNTKEIISELKDELRNSKNSVEKALKEKYDQKEKFEKDLKRIEEEAKEKNDLLQARIIDICAFTCQKFGPNALTGKKKDKYKKQLRIFGKFSKGLHNKLRNTVIKLNRAKNELTKNRKILVDKNHKYENLKICFSKLKKELATTDRNLNNLISENTSLRKKFEDTKKCLEIADHHEQYNNTRFNDLQKCRELNNLKKKVEKDNSTIIALRNKLHRSESANINKGVLLNSYKNQLVEITKEHDQCSKKSEVLESENNSLRSKNAKLKAKISLLDIEKEKLVSGSEKSEADIHEKQYKVVLQNDKLNQKEAERIELKIDQVLVDMKLKVEVLENCRIEYDSAIKEFLQQIYKYYCENDSDYINYNEESEREAHETACLILNITPGQLSRFLKGKPNSLRTLLTMESDQSLRASPFPRAWVLNLNIECGNMHIKQQ